MGDFPCSTPLVTAFEDLNVCRCLRHHHSLTLEKSLKIKNKDILFYSLIYTLYQHFLTAQVFLICNLLVQDDFLLSWLAGVSSTFLAGGQMVFRGSLHSLNWISSLEKISSCLSNQVWKIFYTACAWSLIKPLEYGISDSVAGRNGYFAGTDLQAPVSTLLCMLFWVV